MPKDLKAYKVFIASPGGLKEEREAFRDEINSYNESEAVARGVLFDLVGWEATLGGVGRLAGRLYGEKGALAFGCSTGCG
jgi:hypothetical protein